MFMDALLGRSSAVRTVAVTFEPIPPERSTREVEAAITRDRADRELRHRFGQSETARQRQAQEATLRREAELAAGHGEVRLAGFVTVSGRDRDELRRASAEVLGARRSGSPRAAPHVRPAGRRVHVHAAALPRAAVRPCWLRSGRAIARDDPPRPGRSTPSWPRAGSADAACSSGATPAAARSASTRGSCTARALLDDPNVIVLGKLGQGKSALVKTLLWRMLLFGRRAFVLDVKREYGPLCDAVGVEPISLVPGGGVRLNPLASRPEEHAQLELLRAVTMTAIGGAAHADRGGRAARGAAHGARRRIERADAARDRRGPVRPGRARWPTGCARRRAARRGRAARRAGAPGPVRGPAAGHVRRPDHARARSRRASLLVLDLHAVRDSPAVGILMACATAWMSALLARMAERPGRERLINVADESWKIVQHTGPRRVVSVELQARAPVRRDEPGRAAQARRPAGCRRRRARARRGSPRA